ncbi:MAG: hypothetical protein ABSE49_03965 [Polyangiaceae bacterium]|jgi:hypothetical protein
MRRCSPAAALAFAAVAALAVPVVLAVGCSSTDSGPAGAADAATSADATGPDGAPPGMDGSMKDGALVDGDAGAASDAGGADALDEPPTDAAGDVEGGCEVFYVSGQCILVSSCAALGNHTSYSGYCPGPADIECCVDTENQPVPPGWVLMQQAQVTSAMTTWAVMILNDPSMYPMYATTTMVFGALDVMARVEWHPPDSNNEVVHRGVTLYEPAD